MDHKRTVRNFVAVGVVVVVLALLFSLGTSRGQYQHSGPARWRTIDQHATETTIQVARGNFVDVSQLSVFGRNPDVDASSEEDVWNTGGDYVFPTAAETLTCSSDDVADDGDPGGTGLWTLAIFGLDANFDLISETITLDGTTGVVTTNSYLRVHLGRGELAGSTGSNVGSVTCAQTTSTLTMFTIAPTVSRSQLAFFTVPAGHELLVTRVYGSISRTQNSVAGVSVQLRHAGTANAATQTFGYAGVNANGSSWVSIDYVIPSWIDEKTDIKFRAEAGSNNTDINAGFDGYLIDNR